ncbi:MAG: phosphoenolpyruvate--protein phosphotransferase [Spirochaeta sp.]|jgi:phosphotransferase system enzyme I (PtsI)|nr:phosphoenolpyruvate--protein phosphotransferase [Spirochaeta sp.]
MELPGVSASPGIAHGHAVVLKDTTLPRVDGPGQSPSTEIARFQAAVTQTVSELVQLQQKTRRLLGADFAAIFRSQQTIAEDDDFRNSVIGTIHREGCRAEAALYRVFDGYRALFEELDDGAYNRSRVSDVEDVHSRMQRILLGIEHPDLTDLPAGSVVVATELFPSDTALIDASNVVGIVTEHGGATSHAAILAKNIGVPAVVRVTDVVSTVSPGDLLTVVSTTDEPARVFVNPTGSQLDVIHRTEERLTRRQGMINTFRGQDAVTTDGQRFTVSVNVGSTQELQPARAVGARSIGLYRSEFLFFKQPVLPDEEIQYAAYRDAAAAFSGGFVVIRTLDVGGDKQLPALPAPIEPNPFLGSRGLRFTLQHPDVFLTQIRAILRAAADYPVEMLFPMVGGVDELDAALELVEDAKEQLRARGHRYNAVIPIGVMIEIPSAIWTADALARRVSFFSVGTNDLVQYLMAADRLNGEVEAYYRPFDPSVFRALAHLCRTAAEFDRPVSVCGELGGDPLAIPALAGMGVSGFSMSPSSLADATRVIRKSTATEMKSLAEAVLRLDSQGDITALLRQHYNAKE